MARVWACYVTQKNTGMTPQAENLSQVLHRLGPSARQPTSPLYPVYSWPSGIAQMYLIPSLPSKKPFFSLQNTLFSSHSASQHTLPSSTQKSTSQGSISLSRCHPLCPVPKSDQKPYFFPTSHRCHYQPVTCEWFLKCRPFPASLRTGRGQFLLSFAIFPVSRPVP